MSRSNAAPMDFAWEDGHGPMDPNSPFLTAIQRQKSAANQLNNHPKRARNEFESPTRSQNSAFPSLRPAAGQTTLFSNLPRPPSPKKPLPPTPLDAFRTPRKFDVEFSSGGETPATPENDADSEATPDMRHLQWMSPSRKVQAAQQDERKTSPKKKRPSLFDRIWSPSSRSALKPYSTKAEKRVAKRRTHRRMFSRSRPNDDPDSDAGEKSKAAPPAQGGFHAWLGRWLRLVEQHPNAPSILITYLQLLSNLLLVLMSMYVVYSLWCGILGDVDKGVNESKAEAMLQIANCRKDWLAFRCEDKIERTRELCEGIESCISRNPETVARAQVSARTFARIINDFAEPISLKAMVFYLSVFGIFWWGTNATWNGLRSKLSAEHFSHQNQQYPGLQMPPPATPHRHLSNGMLQTPYANHNSLFNQPYFQPGPDPAASAMAGAAERAQAIEYG